MRHEKSKESGRYWRSYRSFQNSYKNKFLYCPSKKYNCNSCNETERNFDVNCSYFLPSTAFSPFFEYRFFLSKIFSFFIFLTNFVDTYSECNIFRKSSNNLAWKCFFINIGTPETKQSEQNYLIDTDKWLSNLNFRVSDKPGRQSQLTWSKFKATQYL